MKYSDLISFHPIEDVIQLVTADDKNKAREYVKTYVMSDTMAESLQAPVIDQLQMDEVVDNKGVLIVGNYGTGKSHLMSVISAIATDADNVQYLQNKKFAEQVKPIAGKFEVLRIEIGGVVMPLYDVIMGYVQEDFEKRGIDFDVPEYDEATDDYHREPFAADVSEGKTDPIYMAHTYHTKVPYKAIMRYILHYTKPGDIVFDGFCGTGMTGLAAQMCGVEHDLTLFEKRDSIGARKAIISDLSPVATFIAHNYTSGISQYEYIQTCQEIINSCKKKYSWMYQTRHTDGTMGEINYIVWSDVFICPNCGEELVFWDVAVGDSKEVKSPFLCSKCSASLKKSNCKRAQETIYDTMTGSLITQAKQVPTLINYFHGGKKFEKRVDTEDIELLQKVEKELQKYRIPMDELPMGDNTVQPMQSHNFCKVSQFYYSRSAVVFAYFFEQAKMCKYPDAAIFLATSILTKTGSKLHNIGFKDGKLNLAGAMPNVLYVPSTVAERNIIDLLESKLNDIMKILEIRSELVKLCLREKSFWLKVKVKR